MIPLAGGLGTPLINEWIWTYLGAAIDGAP